MSFHYKEGINVIDMLKARGYTTYRIRREHIFGERVLQKFRDSIIPSWNELDTLCNLLVCEPWDLIEYVDDGATRKENAQDKKGSHE